MNINTKVKIFVKDFFPQLSYKYLGYKNPHYIQRVKVINHLGINVFFDIGANIGHYAHSLRNFGYKGKIVSFEPMNAEFQVLTNRAVSDENWLTCNYGFGNSDEELDINISKNSVSSSLLKVNSELTEIVPETAYIGTEKVKIYKIDSIIDDFIDEKSKLFIKIDAQGYESEIIKGATNSLNKIIGFKLELPFFELYNTEKTFLELVNFMDSIGFRLIYIEPGWNNPITGFSIEADGIFVKKEIL
ncbi:[alpha-L-fucopyranosyl-(1-_3)-alpha-L-rhamnopyran osyl-(1-_3)-2-O-methyl-alpha-L-rhamnopyranosyl] dimycocerosyl phenol-phthiocerol 2'''-O-methyltransferase [Candidatus Kapaibacterium sp.]